MTEYILENVFCHKGEDFQQIGRGAELFLDRNTILPKILILISPNDSSSYTTTPDCLE